MQNSRIIENIREWKKENVFTDRAKAQTESMKRNRNGELTQISVSFENNVKTYTLQPRENRAW